LSRLQASAEKKTKGEDKGGPHNQDNSENCEESIFSSNMFKKKRNSSKGGGAVKIGDWKLGRKRGREEEYN